MGQARSLSRPLAQDDGGTTALEFALILPLWIGVTLGIIEMAFFMLVDSSLEIAVREASRYGLTVQTTQGVTRDEAIEDIIEDRIRPWIPADHPITIDVKLYPSFEYLDQPEPFTDANDNGQWDSGEAFQDINKNGVYDRDVGLAGAGGPEDVVQYSVAFDRESTTGVLAFFGLPNTVTFRRTFIVQNE